MILSLSSSLGRIAVWSSNLRSVAYNAWNGTLEVEFRSGSIYQHYDVPRSVYDRLMRASSKGSYYYYNLRNRYGCTRIN
jgi:KTSC domain